MRFLSSGACLATILLVACGGQQRANSNPVANRVAEDRSTYPSVDTTYLQWDKGHGYQVTYFGEKHVWLWYPGNTAALRGEWVQEVVAGGYYLCFTYPKSSYNPVTGFAGGQKECQPLAVLEGALAGAIAGDEFNLSSGSIPYVLRRGKKPDEF
ncbi:hypothetical protein [Leisingera sp. ANG-S5]|uniref:hypothetical protein n=1 Tax=Leisingera sp. ANG-S5 TaxID=1577901 RepID=UPI0009E36D68|nr:hypothetical protein [Leisingera sp. ANG-S5]